MRMQPRRTATAALALAGLLLFAQGIWVRARSLLAQAVLDHAWERTLEAQQPVRPWPGAGTRPVARLESPRLGVSLVVLSDTSDDALSGYAAFRRRLGGSRRRHASCNPQQA